jgi:molybdopterin molybdotransferase
VVPVENVAILTRTPDGMPARIRLLADVVAHQHVRDAGEDIRRDALALSAGHWIGAAHRLLLAGLGIATVAVARQPRVALLCTGRELVDDPTQALQPGQIRNANGPYLAARLEAAGARLVRRETVPDDAAAFTAALERALRDGADLVLSTGAVSMGRHDFVPDALRALGARIVFHKVAMRPGKPLLFARLAGGQLFFGLPGNPVSSAVGLRFFVEPALRAQLGLPVETAWRLPLAHAVRKKPGARLLQMAALRLAADGCLRVALCAGQESFKTHALVAADAWAVLPEDGDWLPAGTPVDVFAPGHEASAFLGDQQA